MHRVTLEILPSRSFNRTHRAINIHLAQNEATMLQKIAKPLEFSRLRRNGVLIRRVVSDDVKCKPVKSAEGQIFLVRNCGRISLLFVCQMLRMSTRFGSIPT